MLVDLNFKINMNIGIEDVIFVNDYNGNIYEILL